MEQPTSLATVYFLIQGIGGLLPWNGVLSTLDFYDNYYPDKKAYFIIPMATLLSSIALNFFMVVVRSKFSINFRIAWSNVLTMFLIILLPIIAVALPDSFSGYLIILVTLFFTGAINSITNASLYGVAGYFPSKCMSDFNTGTGIGGIIPNLLRIFIMLVLPETSEKTDWKGIAIYYSISGLFLLFCVFIHFKFINTDYAREKLRISGERTGTVHDW